MRMRNLTGQPPYWMRLSDDGKKMLILRTDMILVVTDILSGECLYIDTLGEDGLQPPVYVKGQ